MIKFGTDGWRGVIADDFTFDRLWLVACAISRYVVRSASGDPPRMLVGYDTRFNSGGFAELCAVAASRHGIDVKMSAITPRHPSVPNLIMITRLHPTSVLR
ncbi:MAG: hypothetical protein KJ686_07445 [Actinobacteria bacterium]|nr:hypothetical protein [Actinomycetota bacterium]